MGRSFEQIELQFLGDFSGQQVSEPVSEKFISGGVWQPAQRGQRRLLFARCSVAQRRRQIGSGIRRVDPRQQKRGCSAQAFVPVGLRHPKRLFNFRVIEGGQRLERFGAHFAR